jgi:hypothetical protein
MGCQKILDPRGASTFEKRKSQKKWGALWRWKKKVYIVKNMMAITWNNELEFQKLPKNHPF